MSNLRHRIRTHKHVHLPAFFYAIIFVLLHYFIHTCIARFISHFRHSLLRQSLSESYYGFHRVLRMLIISQIPLRFIPEYIKLVKADSQELGWLFDYRLCVIIAKRALYISHSKLLVWSGYLVGIIWNIKKETVPWDIRWHCFPHISSHWRTLTSSNIEVLESLLSVFYIWQKGFGSNNWGIFSPNRGRSPTSG